MRVIEGKFTLDKTLAQLTMPRREGKGQWKVGMKSKLRHLRDFQGKINGWALKAGLTLCRKIYETILQEFVT